MNKLLLALLVVLSGSLHAQDGQEIVPYENTEAINDAAKAKTLTEPKPLEAEYVAASSPDQKIEVDVRDPDEYKPRESHWYATFGFEAMEYDLPFQYVGDKEKYGPEKRQLYGGRLGFGGEIHLGAGFMTSTRIEGYYMGTLFEKAKTADPGLEDEDIATAKDSGQIYGADAVQTLSYLWDIRTRNPFMDTDSYVTIEPFVEAGIGRAQAWNKKDYSYNIPTQTVEEYDQSFKDELTNVKIGGGINITSRKGFFLYLRATQNRYDITKRTTKGYGYPNGGSRTDVDPNPSTKLDPIMVYSLGGGYKF